MIEVTITTETGYIFWNKKQIKKCTLTAAKKNIHKELLRTKAQIKDVTVICTGDLNSTFNFDEDTWEDNGVNFKKEVDAMLAPKIKEKIFENELEEYDYKVSIVDKKRRQVYSNKTDPLLNEARIKRLLGEDEEADILEIEVLTLHAQIQTELPYPIKPTTE